MPQTNLPVVASALCPALVRLQTLCLRPTRLLCPTAWTLYGHHPLEWIDEQERREERRFMQGRKNGKTQKKKIWLLLIQLWGFEKFIFTCNFYWFLKFLAMLFVVCGIIVSNGDRIPALCSWEAQSSTITHQGSPQPVFYPFSDYFCLVHSN